MTNDDELKYAAERDRFEANSLNPLRQEQNPENIPNRLATIAENYVTLESNQPDFKLADILIELYQKQLPIKVDLEKIKSSKLPIWAKQYIEYLCSYSLMQNLEQKIDFLRTLDNSQEAVFLLACFLCNYGVKLGKYGRTHIEKLHSEKSFKESLEKVEILQKNLAAIPYERIKMYTGSLDESPSTILSTYRQWVIINYATLLSEKNTDKAIQLLENEKEQNQEMRSLLDVLYSEKRIKQRLSRLETNTIKSFNDKIEQSKNNSIEILSILFTLLGVIVTLVIPSDKFLFADKLTLMFILMFVMSTGLAFLAPNWKQILLRIVVALVCLVIIFFINSSINP